MKMTLLVLASGLACAFPSLATADAVDDDLAVVRNATASSSGERQVQSEAPTPRPEEEPRWLRVRIVERGHKKATVKINLPLFLLDAVGDDVPIPACEDLGGLTLGEVLRALDSGEDLVEIQDEDATVRVWVE